MTYLGKYKGIEYNVLKRYFFDVKKIYDYGNNINAIYKNKSFFKRVGSHLLLVKKKYIYQTLKKGKYINELKIEIGNIKSKKIKYEEYCILLDHKNDQAREVVDYIIKSGIIADIYVLSDDNMFWFFHDMGHSYLADICNNFYENVYGYPEQLVNLFAVIKLKQYGLYNYDYVINQAVTRCYAYSKEDHEYFVLMLNELNLKNDYIIK